MVGDLVALESPFWLYLEGKEGESFEAELKWAWRLCDRKCVEWFSNYSMLIVKEASATDGWTSSVAERPNQFAWKSFSSALKNGSGMEYGECPS
jgi:hypothetical protein